MVDRLYNSKTLADRTTDAIDYAWNDPEQRFEWLNIQTRRRAFRNLATMPGELYSWSLTSGAKGGKPLFPDLSKSHSNPGAFIDSNLFTGLLFKNALDISAKFGLATFVKTATVGYSRNEKYKRILAASDEMLALAHTAPVVDDETAATIGDIIETRQTPLEQLALHGNRANEVMMRFAKGTLAVTSENLELLQQSLRSLAIISEQRAGLAPALAGSVAETTLSPSEPLKRVIRADHVQSPYDAALYLTALSGLATDGAFDVASEIYRHKGDHYLNANESLSIAKTIEQTFNRHQLQMNRRPDGSPVLADYPVDIMLQQTPKGLAPASAHTIIAVVNDSKQALGFLKPKIVMMLDYADTHFTEVDEQLSIGKMHIAQQDEVKRQSQRYQAQRPTPASSNLANITPDAYYKANELGVDHIIREQSRHEMWKLYGRSLPTYLYQAPINLVERLMLPDKKTGKWMFNSKVVKSELMAAGWMAAYNPAAESFAGVGMYEATRLGRAQAVNQSRHMDQFLAAAVKTTQSVDAAFSQTLNELNHADTLRAIHLKYSALLNKPTQQRTSDDYAQIAMYFDELADATKSLAEPVYALLAPNGGGFDGFKQHIQQVLLDGPSNATDALAVFSLVRFIQTMANEQILSMEFVSPDDVVADKETLNRLTAHMMQRLSQHGFAVNGATMNRKGKPIRIVCNDAGEGALVKRSSNGSFQPVSEREMVSFANELTHFMRSKEGVNVARLFDMTTGHMSEHYMMKLEQELLGVATLPALPDAERTIVSGGSDQNQQAPLALTTPLKHRPVRHDYWHDLRAHVSRPEAKDEMIKLRDRTAFIAMFGIPVKMMANSLRGDFGNSKGMFGKWSLASTGFHAAASTLAASYGAVALRETTSLSGYWLIEDALGASQLLYGAIGAIGADDVEVKKEFAARTGMNPLLGNKSVEKGLHNLARATNISKSDNHQVASSFVHGEGSKLVDVAISALSASAEHEDYRTVIQNLESAAQNTQEAVTLLASVDALIQTQRESVNVLEYKGVSHRIMSDKGLRKLVDHIHDRAYTEGLMASSNDKGQPMLINQRGTPVSAELLIAFANDVAEQAKQVMSEHLKESSSFTQLILEDKLKAAEQSAVLNAL